MRPGPACAARTASPRRPKTNPDAIKAAGRGLETGKAAAARRRDRRTAWAHGDEIFRARPARGAPATHRRPGPGRRARGHWPSSSMTRQAEAVSLRRLGQPQGSLRCARAALQRLVRLEGQGCRSTARAAALKISADRHSIAAAALELILETPGPKGARAGRPVQSIRPAAARRMTAIARSRIWRGMIWLCKAFWSHWSAIPTRGCGA